MQSQVNTHLERERASPRTVATPFLFTSGELVSLADIVPSARAKIAPVNTEEIPVGNSVDSTVQHLVGSGIQRCITIVTNGVPLGHIQTAIPAEGLSQPFLVTMQNGQQVLTVPSGVAAEETIVEEEEEEAMESWPLTKKLRLEELTSRGEAGTEKELLQRQLQEANRRAQEYRYQLLRKEKEAEQYRLQLEAMAHQQPKGVDFTVVGEMAEVTSMVITEREREVREMRE